MKTIRVRTTTTISIIITYIYIYVVNIKWLVIHIISQFSFYLLIAKLTLTENQLSTNKCIFVSTVLV